MSSGPIEPGDLLDLQLLPSWLKESAPAANYEHYQGEPEGRGTQRDGRPGGSRGGGPERRFPGRDGGGGNRPRSDRKPPSRDGKHQRPRSGPPQNRGARPREDDYREREQQQKLAQDLAARVTVRFVPHPPVLENVVTQIQSNPVAYSVFALARLFLEKPERYDVHLTTKPEAPLYQLGEDGPISQEREFLESNAFRLAQNEFYKAEVTQSDPIKGNFAAVARCRASGTLLGPTNHHGYQPKLRALYEQRFSRRMSFPDYQRQIEIVNDPAAVEQWKEEARNVTTWTSLKEEPPLTFNNVGDVERHFRQHYLSALVRPVTEQVMDGVVSRQLADRLLRRVVEDAWSRETRSPSQMMQELSSRFRDANLHIFRHRRGMLFVTSVRPRPFGHAQAGASAQVQAILQTLAANAGINRKDLAETVLVEVPAEDMETRRMALASDLRWLISEGNVMEFNDGSLDLPKVKAKPAEGAAGEPGAAAQSAGTTNIPPGESSAGEGEVGVAPAGTSEASSGPPVSDPAKPEPAQVIAPAAELDKTAGEIPEPVESQPTREMALPEDNPAETTSPEQQPTP